MVEGVLVEPTEISHWTLPELESTLGLNHKDLGVFSVTAISEGEQ